MKIVSARPPSAEAERVWQNRLLLQMAVAETKAWADLGRYKFKNFGYWAAWWVKLNQMREASPGAPKIANPFRVVVSVARAQQKEKLYSRFIETPL